MRCEEALVSRAGGRETYADPVMIIHILVNDADYAATLADDVKTSEGWRAPRSILRDETARASSRLFIVCRLYKALFVLSV